MRSVQLDMTVVDRSAADVYTVLADFSRYPEFSPAVRTVTVTASSADTTVSRWEVNFRKGILCWVEEDTFHPADNHIDFRQLEGDVALFEGSWTCTDTEDGTRVVFAADLDMGIPTLADALEPIAVRTLIDNTQAIVGGLFGGAPRIDNVVVAAPEAAPVPSRPRRAVTAG
jgi:ribosome-associated toxin RatA of RatAB toxin-antitoxin module